jgi:hypothetical protein
MTFAVGSLVRARGREWVVLPQSEPDLLMLRPLGGSEEEVTGIYVPLEPVEQPALPDQRQGLIVPPARDASGSASGECSLSLVRSPGNRATALPTRAVKMASSIHPHLIADDVGIAKTVEAALIAVNCWIGASHAPAVICPLNWPNRQRSFATSSTLTRKVSGTATSGAWPAAGRSLFGHHHFVIVSLDFIKSAAAAMSFCGPATNS